MRTKAQALLNAHAGIGIVDSNHLYKLAVDLNLFKNGVYITDVKEYKQFADYWLTLNKNNEAGYYFKDKNGKQMFDSGHFEAD